MKLIVVFTLKAKKPIVFEKSPAKDQYAHYTLFGIASEVGFSSKSSFNATFKKVKGLTPTQFKNSIPKNKISQERFD